MQYIRHSLHSRTKKAREVVSYFALLVLTGLENTDSQLRLESSRSVTAYFLSLQSSITSLRKRQSVQAEQMFTLELEALYKHLNGRVKKENLAIISKGTKEIFQILDSFISGEISWMLNSSANIADVPKRTRSEEEKAISRRKKSKDKCLIYVKPKEDAIFTPIFLQHKTVKEFKDKLELIDVTLMLR